MFCKVAERIKGYNFVEHRKIRKPVFSFGKHRKLKLQSEDSSSHAKIWVVRAYFYFRHATVIGKPSSVLLKTTFWVNNVGASHTHDHLIHHALRKRQIQHSRTLHWNSRPASTSRSEATRISAISQRRHAFNCEQSRRESQRAGFVFSDYSLAEYLKRILSYERVSKEEVHPSTHFSPSLSLSQTEIVISLFAHILHFSICITGKRIPVSLSLTLSDSVSPPL